MGEKLTDTLEKIEHHGKVIFLSDYRGIAGSEMAAQIRENARVALELAHKGETNQLRLTDLRGCFATQEIMDAFKEAGAQLAPHFKASAVLGIEGMKKHLLRLVNQFAGLGARPFDSAEEAKDWLVRQ